MDSLTTSLAQFSSALLTRTTSAATALTVPHPFDAAHAEFRRLRAIEKGFGPYATIAEEEAEQGEYVAAQDATSAAFAAMVTIPVSDGTRTAAKLDAIMDLYDLGACGIDRNVLAQVRGEIEAVLSPAIREDHHRAILAPRNEALATVNGNGDLDEEDADRLINIATEAENLICQMQATTIDGAAVKMLTLLQMAAIGHEVSDDMAWPIVEEAAALLGIPTLAGMGYPTPADQIAREAAAEARS